jgi:L-ascorbate metabolism protein UlaG (beta-lactamase superfamily)
MLALAVLGSVAPAASAQMTGDHISTNGDDLIIHPVNHASLVMTWGPHPIYVDPVGGAARYDGLPRPHMILITHAHGDHFNAETLTALATGSVRIFAPQAVADQLPDALKSQTTVMANGDKTDFMGVSIEAVPAYNTTPERLRYHPKGQGNGYVLTVGGKRIYISGDTEDTPEMRALQNIDVAFLCMNLPYTMTEEQAADAVKAFKPKIVYPYHYQGSDPKKFASLVGDASEVRLRDWYAPGS